MCGLDNDNKTTVTEVNRAVDAAQGAILSAMLSMSLNGLTEETVSVGRETVALVDEAIDVIARNPEAQASSADTIEELRQTREHVASLFDIADDLVAEVAELEAQPSPDEIEDQERIAAAKLGLAIGLLDEESGFDFVAGTIDLLDPTDVEGSLRVAVEVKRPVVFHYRSEGSTGGPSSAKRTVSPYDVRPGSHGPLLFGYDHDRQGVRQFRLDLIELDNGETEVAGSLGPASQFVAPSPALTGVAR